MVTVLDTGLNTMTGGQLKCAEPHLTDGAFMFDYGDGVGDVDLDQLLKSHDRHGKTATIAMVSLAQSKGV